MKTNVEKAYNSALNIESNVGEIQYSLRYLRAVKQELMELESDLDIARGDGWNYISSLHTIEDVERRVILVNLAVESIYKELQSTLLKTVVDTTTVCNELETGLKGEYGITAKII